MVDISQISMRTRQGTQQNEAEVTGAVWMTWELHAT